MEEAFLKIDQAAVALLRTLDEYEEEVKSCLAAQELTKLRAEVTNLRRALLGLEMGVLYHDWEGSASDVEGKISSACDAATPDEDAVAPTASPAGQPSRGQSKA